jgi:hypothetical protein
MTTKWRVRLEWKPPDCWIGVFWKRSTGPFGDFLDVWVCLVPMIPIHISRGVT